MNDKLKVKSAGKKGRGVFAQLPILKNSTIEKSPYILIPSAESNHINETILGNYWYSVDGKSTAIGLGYTSLYNHSKTPNARWIVLPKTRQIKVIALKQINKDEEVTINYGYELK